MRKTVIGLCVALGVFALATGAAAQCPPYDRTEFDNALNAANAQIDQLEQLVYKIETSKVLSDADGDVFDETVNGYASNMFTAYQIAYEAAHQAGTTEGQQGDGRLLAEFEAVAVRDEPRTYQMAHKWELIHAGINQGEIRQTTGVKGSASLAPTAQEHQMMMRTPVRPGFLALATQSQQQQSGPLAKVMDLLFPEAHAAQIAKCVPPCAAKNWAACVACILQGSATVINAWNSFINEWNAAGPCKWYRPWACARKAWALVKFIAVVA
jgi:hypothetical protein